MKELLRLLDLMQGDETPRISFAKGDSERTTMRENFSKIWDKQVKLKGA